MAQTKPTIWSLKCTNRYLLLLFMICECRFERKLKTKNVEFQSTMLKIWLKRKKMKSNVAQA